MRHVVRRAYTCQRDGGRRQEGGRRRERLVSLAAVQPDQGEVQLRAAGVCDTCSLHCLHAKPLALSKPTGVCWVVGQGYFLPAAGGFCEHRTLKLPALSHALHNLSRVVLIYPINLNRSTRSSSALGNTLILDAAPCVDGCLFLAPNLGGLLQLHLLTNRVCAAVPTADPAQPRAEQMPVVRMPGVRHAPHTQLLR